MAQLRLQQANEIIDSALRLARERGFRPMAVVVVDDAGQIKAVQREDDASMLRVDIATGKAWAAVGMGAANTLAATAEGKVPPQAGAFVIKDADGRILGAVAASGGSGDEEEAVICIEGVERAGLQYA